jgi:deoxycytidylate deaminase
MSLINVGVERIVYDREYRLTEGVELLREAGIVVEQFELY